jgi:hypothetical protein
MKDTWNTHRIPASSQENTNKKKATQRGESITKEETHEHHQGNSGGAISMAGVPMKHGSHRGTPEGMLAAQQVTEHLAGYLQLTGSSLRETTAQVHNVFTSAGCICEKVKAAYMSSLGDHCLVNQKRNTTLRENEQTRAT